MLDVCCGLKGAVTGVVMDPLEGLWEGGAVGFAEGLGYGIAGLAAKPLVGLLDAATFTMEGVSDLANQMRLDPAIKPVRMRRLCHVHGMDGR